jgi:hypothetical protein
MALRIEGYFPSAIHPPTSFALQAHLGPFSAQPLASALSMRCAPNHLADARLNFAIGIVWDQKVRARKCQREVAGYRKLTWLVRFSEQAKALGSRASEGSALPLGL